jgi:hypothetical protein
MGDFTFFQEFQNSVYRFAYLDMSGGNRSLYYIVGYFVIIGIMLFIFNNGINQFNFKQKFILYLGLVIFLLFVIIPPWSMYFFNYKINFIGYRLIFYDYPIKYFTTPFEDYGKERVEIDYYIFNYQMIALFIVVAIAVFFCRKEKSV